MIRTSSIMVGCLAALFVSASCRTPAPVSAAPTTLAESADGEGDSEGLERRKKRKKKRRGARSKDQSGLGLAPSGSGGGAPGGAGSGVRLERRERYAAPPPTGVVAGPSLSFSFSPKRAKAGGKVTLTLSAPVGGVQVYFAGDELSAESKQNGKVLIVTLPKDASSGYLELRVNGQRFKASEQLEVL